MPHKRNFSNWLKAYAQFTRESESSDSFHFWTGVSMVAGALRRQVWIDQIAFQWTPNFYIIFVAKAGVVAKSTTIGIGTRLLEQVPGIKFGPESLTWQALGVALAEAAEVIRFSEVDSDKITTSPLTIAASELGTLFKLDDDGLTSMLIAMWDGQKSLRPWKHRTVSSSQIEVRNPWLNIIGCTTPAWLAQNFPEHMIGGGLTSRIIFVHGERKRQLVAYPGRAWRGAKVSIDGMELDISTLEKMLVDDLTKISMMKGEYRLTEAAEAWGVEWYNKLWSGTLPPHLASDRYSGYIARKQTHLHKIAIVLAAAQSDELVITEQHLREALILLETTEPDMIKVFESIGQVDQSKHIATISSMLRSYGPLDLQKLFSLVMNVLSQEEFELAIKAGVEGGVFSARRVYMPDGSPLRQLVLN